MLAHSDTVFFYFLEVLDQEFQEAFTCHMSVVVACICCQADLSSGGELGLELGSVALESF